jgi:hypothetical protein
MCVERHGVGVAALVTLVCATAARGAVVDMSATTLLADRPDVRDGEVEPLIPIYELLSVSSSGLEVAGMTDVRLMLTAWGSADPGSPRDDRHLGGDVGLAYAEGSLFERRLTLRAGRQLVLGGATRSLQLDGLSVASRFASGFGLALYGGAPVTRRFETDRGDAATGGRVSYRHSFTTEVGASAITVLDDGRLARQDVGVDGRFLPLQAVVVTAFVLWSAPEGRLAEAEARALWQLSPTLSLSLDARRTAPDLFLPRNSILSVFSEETRDELGGRADYAGVRRWALSAAYHALVVDGADGYRADAEARWTSDEQARTLIGVDVRRLQVPGIWAADGYWETRIFAIQRLTETLALSADGDLYLFDNAEDHSFLAGASLAYRLGEAWEAVVHGKGGATPLFERYYEAIFRIAYNATIRRREVIP